jgi:hypothetical protein
MVGGLCCGLLGCGDDDDGGGGGGPGASGVDSNKQLIQLSDGDKQQLCTWTEMVSPVKPCPDGSMGGVDPGECMQQFSSIASECTATVADQEKCAQADACDFAAVVTACTPLFACI